MTRVTLLATLVFAVACGGHDKDDEDNKAPSRVHGREIVIDDKSRTAIELAVAPATGDELPDTRLRYGKAIARPGDELVVSSPDGGTNDADLAGRDRRPRYGRHRDRDDQSSGIGSMQGSP